MNIINCNDAPRYNRDGNNSFLVVSKRSRNSNHISVTLVEMDIDGFQYIHKHEAEQAYMILEGSGIVTANEEKKQ